MKIRNGFVSNSSSSSFTMILTEEDHQKIMEKIDEISKELIKYYIGKATIGNQKVVILQNNTGEAFEYDGEMYFMVKGNSLTDKPADFTKKDIKEIKSKYGDLDYLYESVCEYKNKCTELKIKTLEIDINC